MQRSFQPRPSQTLNKAVDGNIAKEVNGDDLGVQINNTEENQSGIQ